MRTVGLIIVFSTAYYGLSSTLPVDLSCEMSGFVRRNGEMWTQRPTGVSTPACLSCKCRNGKVECRRCEIDQLNAAATFEFSGVNAANSQSKSLTFNNDMLPIQRDWSRYTTGRGNSKHKPTVCFGNGVYHQHGDTFSGGNIKQISPDRSVCTQCACVKGETYCRTKICPTPNSCVQQPFTDDDCCPPCGSILSNFPVLARKGSSEKTSAISQIPNQAAQMPFVRRLPTNDVNHDDSCTFDGKQYKNDGMWKADLPRTDVNLCVECKCVNGEAKCRIPKCPELKPAENCQETRLLANRCCAECIATKTITSLQKEKTRNKTLCVSVYHFVTKHDVTSSQTAPNATTQFNYVLAVNLTSSIRVYNWSLHEDQKLREVLTLRRNIYEKFAAEKQAIGSFQFAGYSNEQHLRAFQRKEGLWNKRCRRICALRLRKILQALRLKPNPEECDNKQITETTQAQQT